MEVNKIRLSKFHDFEQDGKDFLVAQIFIHKDANGGVNMPILLLKEDLEQIKNKTPIEIAEWFEQQLDKTFLEFNNFVADAPAPEAV